MRYRFAIRPRAEQRPSVRTFLYRRTCYVVI